MFCRNCGAQNADDAMFCKECGSKLIVEPGEVPADTPVYNPVSPEFGNNNLNNISGSNRSFVEILKGIPKKVYAIVGGVIAALIVILVVYMNVSSTINLDKYVTVSYSGYDGYGKATVSIDWDAIEKKYGSKVKLTKAASNEMGEYQELFNKPVEILRYAIDNPELSKSDNLSNGDKITYKWDIDEDMIKEGLKCKLKYSDTTVKVSGLEKVDTFDAFDDLSVEFTGVGPDGRVEYTYDGDILDTSYFYCDEQTGLSNGDKVTIYLYNDDPEYYAENFGKIPAETEKEYKVEGLGKYATKVSDVDDDTLEDAKKEAESIVKDSCSSFGSDETLTAVTYVGDYLEVIKDKKDSYSNKNTFGMVYKIDVQIQPENCDPTPFTYYYDVRYSNIVVNEDKSCNIDFDNYEKTWNSVSKQIDNPNSFWGSYYSYTGFESIDALMNYRKNYNQTYYNTEWNIEGVDTTAAANGEDYICSYSAEREITTDEVNTYMNTDYSSYGFPGGRTVVQMIINEMYARHGYEFTDAELTDYFNQKEWYSSITTKTTDMDGIYNNMSSVEQANVTLLQQYK